ncbi:MAG: pantoate--beta-alanine ligase [Acidobacteria bacterium]|nr:pantoate--beta-alanine ligase [Acidobacteriota bacterium]
MQVERTIDGARRAVAAARQKGRRVALVPTMGYLHDGHLSLVDLARAHSDFVVVSIFVNPRQFGPSEDLDTYPRDEERDQRALEARNVDLLFAPEPDTVYPHRFATTVSVGGVAEPLEGERRPGHFDGVATVVLKLFNIVQPDLAVFGQKDAQQCAVIRRVVDDLNLPVEILIAETRREPDGLAMSSRNSYLDHNERERATLLHRALTAGRDALQRRETPDEAEIAMRDSVNGSVDVRIDYLRVVDPETFQRPVDTAGDLLVVGAMYVGGTRLIDNLEVARQDRSKTPE